MPIGPALPADRRAAVEQLLRDTDLTFTEIEARTGISRRTVSTWNIRSGPLRPRRLSRRSGPAAWRHERREALVRLYRETGNDPGDLAEAAGIGRASATALFRALGLPPRPAAAGPPRPRETLAPLDPVEVADAPTLRAHLRAHIARQIAAFDAALKGEGAAVLDSARVLRDLAGLKRLFDEVAGGGRDRAGEGGDGGTGPEPGDPRDLRAEIARRYARFVGGRATA